MTPASGPRQASSWHEMSPLVVPRRPVNVTCCSTAPHAQNGGTVMVRLAYSYYVLTHRRRGLPQLMSPRQRSRDLLKTNSSLILRRYSNADQLESVMNPYLTTKACS